MKNVVRTQLFLVAVSVFIVSLAAENALAVVETDVPYIEAAVSKQKMDLYLPDKSGFPVVLFVHGGSLVEGDRKDAPLPRIADAFKKNGIGFAVMSYRLGPENKWPSQPDDVAAAFAWLKRNIAKRGGNAKKIFVVGHSSGGLLTALHGTDEKYLKKNKLNLSDIAGCIPMGTLLTNTFNLDGLSAERQRSIFEKNAYLSIFGSYDVLRDSIPIAHVSKNMPPFLILIAEAEQHQPPILNSAREFAAAAGQTGSKVEIEVLKGRTHYEAINQMVNTEDPTLSRILKFVKAH